MAFGYNALLNNNTGNSNLSIGNSSLFYNTTGEFNLAIGNNSLYSGTTGEYNIAIGNNSLSNNLTGNYNIAIGNNSLLSGTTGSNNIAIGFNTFNNGNYQNSIAIGNNITIINDNQFILGAVGMTINFNQNSIENFTIGNTGTTGATGGVIYNSNDKKLYYNSSKTFVIDHPTDNSKYLVHACLEGPEAGVYYRGRGIITNNEYTEIILPDYVDRFSYDFNVQITQIHNGNKDLYTVSEVIDNKFIVYGTNGKFFWVVFGCRNIIEVEPLKTNVKLNGNGPYTWLS
jgi:hypothetical protein